MKLLLCAVFAALWLAVGAQAQPTPGNPIIFVASDPAGSCIAGTSPMRFNYMTGQLWGCNGTWNVTGYGGSGQYSTASVTYSNSTTYFFPAGGGLAGSTTEANVKTTQGSAATIGNMAVSLSANAGSSTLAFTFRDNGSSQSVTCSITGSTNTCSDTPHSFTVAAGDLLDIQMAVSGADYTGGVIISWSTPAVSVGCPGLAAGKIPVGLSGTTCGWTPPLAINVKSPQFGCYGDDVHDDSACFQSAYALAVAYARTDTTPSTDTNKLGSIEIDIPPGTYLVKSSQALMAASYTTRTVGITFRGAGAGVSYIDYQPSASGPLFSNHDAWLFVTMNGIGFTSNDAASDFIDSYSTGGAQDYHFEDIYWRGTWQYIMSLSGTNTNSEMKWHAVSFSGTVNTFLYIPNAGGGGSDQFLNYWFSDSNFGLSSGNFINAYLGGHFNIDHCDFSDLNGSGMSGSPNILFALRGTSHARGVTFFSVSHSRFELKTNSIQVLYSEWPSGEVSFDDDDFGSQAVAFTPPIQEFQINEAQNNGGPQYNFSNDVIMGYVAVTTSNSAGWGYRKNIHFENTSFVNYDDWSQGVQIGTISGANYGGYPIVECVRCQGTNISIYNTYTHWAATTAYAANAIVYSDYYAYTTASGCTSGSTAPNGRTASFNDGGCTWSTVDTYFGSDYVQTGEFRVVAGPTNAYSSALKEAVGSGMNYYNSLPSRISASVVGFTRVILPPYATVTRFALNIAAGACSQGTTGTYVIRNDNYSPTTFATEAVAPLSAGVAYDAAPSPYYNTGSDIGSRTIILQANTDVTQSCGGTFMVWYY